MSGKKQPEKLEKKQEQSMSISEMIANLTPEEARELVAKNKTIQNMIHQKAVAEANATQKHELKVFEDTPQRGPKKDKTAVNMVTPGTGIGGKKPVIKAHPAWMVPQLLKSGFIMASDFEAHQKGKRLMSLRAPDGKIIEVPPESVESLLKAGFETVK